VLTGFNIHIIALDKNKDKNTKKTKPYVYMESVRIGLSPLNGMESLGSFAAVQLN